MDLKFYDIIKEPIITEKSMQLKEQFNKYTFKVAKDATKVDIKKAVEKLFSVKVEKVNTINVRGQLRRYGRYEGYRASWKKAIVTLAEGSKTIEFFDGMI